MVLRVLQPWSSVLRLLLGREGAVWAVRRVLFPRAVVPTRPADVLKPLFLALYLFSALILLVFLSCCYFYRHSYAQLRIEDQHS